MMNKVVELVAGCSARIFTCAMPSLKGLLDPFLAYSVNDMI